ncbi:MAG: AzlD domain-containing protein [Ruminococcaceae bacterium]|nr:AzlD domain-containing protein [Oscillospiraceae bacterium]
MSLSFPAFLLYVGVMAGVTYLLRLLPMLFLKKKITNTFIRSVLYYVPYSVLTVMTIPAIFFATPHLATSIAALVTAVALAYFGKSLLIVAAGSALSVFVFELIFMLI